MKRKKKKIKFYILLILIIFFFMIFTKKYIVPFKNTQINSNIINNTETKIKSEDEKQINLEKEEKYSASMIDVGDFLIHSSIYNDAKNGVEYNFKPMLELIKPITINFDIAYYNQETILGGTELGLSNYPRFNSPYEAGDAMIDSGFNFVSLATNHTMDAGKQAIINSKTYWNAKSNIYTAGSYLSQEEKNNSKIIEKNNIKIGMLNYTYGTNGIKVPENEKYFVNVWPMDENIKNPSDNIEYEQYKQIVKNDILRT